MTNNPPFETIVKCMNDERPMDLDVHNWVHKNECYFVTSFSKDLRGGGLCVHLIDKEGKKVEPNEQITAFVVERFSLILQYCLN